MNIKIILSIFLAVANSSSCAPRDYNQTKIKFTENNRIGYFIASADPITIGHLQMVKQFIDEVKISEMHIIINSMAEKDYSGSNEERLELFRLGSEELNLGARIVTSLEPREGKRKYVEQLVKVGKGSAFGIIGEDVQDKAQELFSGINGLKIYVSARLNSDEKNSARSVPLKVNSDPMFETFKLTNVNDISSTLVKKRLAAGESTDGVLPRSVRESVHRNGLYRGLSESQYKTIKLPFLTKLVSDYKLEIAKSKFSNLTLPAEINKFTHTQSHKGTIDMLSRLVIRANSMPDQDQDDLRVFTNKWAESLQVKETFDLFQQNLLLSMPTVAVLTENLTMDNISEEKASYVGSEILQTATLEAQEPHSASDVMINLDNFGRKYNGKTTTFCRKKMCDILMKVVGKSQYNQFVKVK